jgi:hypothetical protein
MRTPWIIVTVVSLYALFFQLTPYIGMNEHFILILFLLAPFLLGYMAYVIIRHGKPSKHTFDERFYEDYNSEGN